MCSLANTCSSSSTSSSPKISSGRCGFPFSAQEVEVSFGGPPVASIFKFIVRVLVRTLLITKCAIFYGDSQKIAFLWKQHRRCPFRLVGSNGDEFVD